MKFPRPGDKAPPLGTHGRVAFERLREIESLKLSRDDELKALLLYLTGMVASLYDDLEKSGKLRPLVTPASRLPDA